MNPDLVTLEGRINTFKKFKKIIGAPLCTAEYFAKAGFYNISSETYPDLVKCHACPVELGNWEKEDDPWEEHVKRGKECPYIELKTANNTIMELKKDISVLTNQLESARKEIADFKESYEKEKNSMYTLLRAEFVETTKVFSEEREVLLQVVREGEEEIKNLKTIIALLKDSLIKSDDDEKENTDNFPNDPSSVQQDLISLGDSDVPPSTAPLSGTTPSPSFKYGLPKAGSADPPTNDKQKKESSGTKEVSSKKDTRKNKCSCSERANKQQKVKKHEPENDCRATPHVLDKQQPNHPKDKMKATYLIGDSLIRNVFPKKSPTEVIPIAGITIGKLTKEIEQWSGDFSHVKLLGLHIGTNDLKSCESVSHFIGDYMNLVETCKTTFRNAKIIVVNIIKRKDVPSKLVNKINSELWWVCNRLNLVYVDINSKIAFFDLLDGLHLKNSGKLILNKELKNLFTLAKFFLT